MPKLAWSFRHLVSLGLIQQRLNHHHHHQLKHYRVQAARRRNLQSLCPYMKHLRNKRTHPILSQNRMKVRPNMHQPIQKATQDQILLLAFLRWNCVPNFGVLLIIFFPILPRGVFPKYLDKALGPVVQN